MYFKLLRITPDTFIITYTNTNEMQSTTFIPKQAHIIILSLFTIREQNATSTFYCSFVNLNNIPY